MARVRMFHAASNRFQYDAAANFEVFHQPEGWVIVDDEDPAPPVAEPESVAAGGESAVPPAEASDPEPPKRGRRA